MPNTETTVRCLVLGDPAHPEMAAVTRFLADEDVVPTDDPGAADLVVVCLTDPDAYSSRDVARVLADSTLARLVVVKSSYCESIGRTRDLWPLAAQVPARNAASRLATERAVLSGTRLPLPLTASRDETWAFDHAVVMSPQETEVRVVSPDRALAECWADQLDLPKGACTTPSAPDDATFAGVLVIDGDPWTDRVRDVVAERRERERPTVVSRTMPPVGPPGRPGDLVTVVPKLAPAETLVTAVARLAERVAHSG